MGAENEVKVRSGNLVVLIVSRGRMDCNGALPNLGNKFAIEVTEPFTTESEFFANACRQQLTNAETNQQVG
jgi:hypothetical protein